MKKMNVKFNYVALDAAYDHLMAEIHRLDNNTVKSVPVKYLKAMDKAQLVAALKAAAQSISENKKSFDTYQIAADAMMDVDHSNLKDADLADMDMDDYWSVIAAAADLDKNDKEAAIEAATSEAITPYVVAAAQALLLLVHSKQLVKLKTQELVESKYTADEYVLETHYKYAFTDDSLLAAAIDKDPNNQLMMLSAEPFSDYDENGLNADNESIYL